MQETPFVNQTEEQNDYSASNIQVLEGIEHVRKRPSMYIGDVGERGLHHCVYEVVDNSIDEALAGHCSEITVIIHSDNSVSVKDNGRGIPVDIHEKEGISALELVMTRLGAGGKFDKDTYKVSGGLHGVGVSCVNALSSLCTVRVYRNNKIYFQSYSKGVAKEKVKEIGETTERGTETRFYPDDSIFNTVDFRFDTLASRLRELSFLNKGVKIILVDEREDVAQIDSKSDDPNSQFFTKIFYSEGGLVEYVKYLDSSRTPLHEPPIYVSGAAEDGGTPVEIAIQYNSSYNENIHSYVNNINTHEGGTHVIGFKKALTRTLKSYAENQGLLKKVKIPISGDDFREGLTCIISVKVAEPQFEGQTKTKLGNSDVAGIVETIVNKQLAYYLEENPKISQKIVQKVILAAEARFAAKKAREAVQKRSNLIGGGLPGKLAPCSSKNPDECELYLVEGDSAGGSAKQARDRRFQAILPLRGKILNVEKANRVQIYENEEIRNIITALGVIIGADEEVSLEKLRYSKLIIMTDADIDGSHIRTLLLTLLYRYMPELIQAGNVYIAMPPLYLVKSGKNQRYCWTEEQRELAVRELGGDNKAHTQRYKGLGEMNPEQLWETTMDPEKRTFLQVSIENAAEADHIFSTLMGDEVAPRREFIELNAKYARIDA